MSIIEKESPAVQRERIEWVDIYKGIAIVLMVVGHATGVLNQYIYQFHMCALILISGYMANLGKRNLGQTFLVKIRALIVPFFTVFALFLCLLSIMNRAGIYPVFFSSEMSYMSITNTVKLLFTRGDNYVYWMGTSWFVLVLFVVFLLSKILHSVCKNKWLYLIASTAFFLAGYILVKRGITAHISLLSFDLIFIANFYFSVGVVLRETNFLNKYISQTRQLLAVSALSLIIMVYFVAIGKGTVDYPSRSFDFFLTDSIAAVNGSIFLYAVSVLISRTPLKSFSQSIAYVGKNTLGILFFHFAAFKIAYIPFYLAGFIPLDYLQNFLPSDTLSSIYWPLVVLISVSTSLIAWRILCAVKPLGILLGDRKTDGRWISVVESASVAICARLRSVWQQLWDKLRPYFTKLNILVTTICVVALIPLCKIGPTLNDELQYRFARMSGLGGLLTWYAKARLREGRPLIFMSIFNTVITYPVKNDLVNDMWRVFLLLIAVLLFGYFSNIITRNKYFGALISVCTAVFMPVTFEHSAPTAYQGLMVISLIYLIISLICYVNHIDVGKKSMYILSMVFFSLALFSFEFMVTFVLLFPAISYTRSEEKSIPLAVRQSVCPVVMSFLFICLFVLTQFFKPETAYEGSTAGFVSLSSSWTILKNLFLSALPGYYVFSDVYQYLSRLYWGMIGSKDVVRILFVCVLLVFAVKLAAGNSRRGSGKLFGGLGLIAAAYMFLPSLPNSISSRYQGIVGEGKGFIALPVTIFLYFAGILAICSFIWLIVGALPKKATACVITAIGVFAFPVQFQTSQFTAVHAQNHQRLTRIESFFDTDVFQSLTGEVVVAPDLYETRNTLGIHDGYWSRYAQEIKAVDVQIDRNPDLFSPDTPFIVYQNDSYFIIIRDELATAVSEAPVTENVLVELPDGNSLFFDFSQDNGTYQDHRFYVSNASSFVVSEESAGQIFGVHPDGWVGPEF